MIQRYLIEMVIVLFAILCAGYMIQRMKQQPSVKLSRKQHVQLAISGVIAFFMDTIGVGSFALNIALAKYFNTFDDPELPPMINGAQVIPGAFEALFFLGLVNVDGLTLIALIIAACLGGVIGASLISKLNAQTIRIIMLIAFPVVIVLILSNEMHWLPIGGNKTALHGNELLLGSIGLFLAGALTSVGVGSFALIQAILFCLGMSPLVAFPIMNAAGAVQQPLSAGIFVNKNKVPLKKTLIISSYGIIGVFLALPIITHMNATTLHILLIIVLSYNTVMMGLNYLKHRTKRAVESMPLIPAEG